MGTWQGQDSEEGGHMKLMWGDIMLGEGTCIYIDLDLVTDEDDMLPQQNKGILQRKLKDKHDIYNIFSSLLYQLAAV